MDKIQNLHSALAVDEIEETPHDLQGDGMNVIILFNIIFVYTTLDFQFGLKLSGNTNTLTKTSSLTNKLYKKGKIENKQQCRKVLDKFRNFYTELPRKILEQMAFNTRPKIQEHMLFAMDESNH